MKRLFIAALVLASCATPEPPKADTATDTREPIATEYVRGATLPIHSKAEDNAPVITTYQAGESVSILSKKGDWAEVRTAFGSGWVHTSELATGSEMPKATTENESPRFIIPVEPVVQPGASGDIVLEADVSANGDVLGVRITQNTTGSDGLAQRNVTALKRAKFAPIMKHGQRMPFTYEHRVHY